MRDQYGPRGTVWAGLYDPAPVPPKITSSNIVLSMDEMGTALKANLFADKLIGAWASDPFDGISIIAITERDGRPMLTEIANGGTFHFDHVPLTKVTARAGAVSEYQGNLNGEQVRLVVGPSQLEEFSPDDPSSPTMAAINAIGLEFFGEAQ